MITFWLLVALWTPSADGHPLLTTEAATKQTSNANLETRGNEEAGRSAAERTAAGTELTSVGGPALAFSTPSYTQSKVPDALSSPMVASNTRTRRDTSLQSSKPSTEPAEAAHSSTTEHKTSHRPQRDSAGLDSGHATTLTTTAQRPRQTSALPTTSGKKVTLTETIGMTTTSTRATTAKIGATSDQKSSPFSQSTTSLLRDKTTVTNKTPVKSTPSRTTFSTRTTTTDNALTTTKLTATTVSSTSTVTTKEISSTTQENNVSGAGTTVGAIIGGAIIIMIGAIVFIMLRKKRRQERNKYNTTWAGPTPFLDGEIQSNIPLGEDDDGGKRQPHKRISVPNFLSGLSSKRESLLKDEEEQVPMEGLVQGSTFSRPQDDVSPPSNGSVFSEEAQPFEATPTPDPESPSPDTSTKGEDNLGQDPIEDDAMPTPPKTETQPDPPAPLVEVDLEPPPEQEALPPPPSDGPIVPPPPPLPPSTE
ncbi:uncharacterized protein [Paramormyrops kingsleyae]|uniref:uncharacterized protein n=1 Tax=Paramormyrops kingsleyae TaxID=1676925 RepID=UPI003B97ABB4